MGPYKCESPGIPPGFHLATRPDKKKPVLQALRRTDRTDLIGSRPKLTA